MNVILYFRFYLFVAGWLVMADGSLCAQKAIPK